VIAQLAAEEALEAEQERGRLLKRAAVAEELASKLRKDLLDANACSFKASQEVEYSRAGCALLEKLLKTKDESLEQLLAQKKQSIEQLLAEKEESTSASISAHADQMSCLQAEMHAMQQELKSQHCADLQLLQARSEAMAGNARAQTLELLAETSAMQQELKAQQCAGLQILHARYDAKAANVRAQSLEQQAESSVELCEHLAARLSAAMLLERKQAALLSGLESAKQQAELERDSAVSVEQASFRHADTLSEKLQAAHEALHLCESLREAELQQLQLSLDSIQMLQEQLRVSEREREERERGREREREREGEREQDLLLQLMLREGTEAYNSADNLRERLEESEHASAKMYADIQRLTAELEVARPSAEKLPKLREELACRAAALLEFELQVASLERKLADSNQLLREKTVEVSLALDKLAQYRRFDEITPAGILADRSLSLSQLLTPEGGDGRESAVNRSGGRDGGQERKCTEQELDTGATMEAMQEELVHTYTELNKCKQICQEQNKEMSPMRKENEALKSQLRISEERVSILRLNAASVDRERQISSPRHSNSTEFSSRTPASPRSTDLVQLLRKVVAERELELHTCRDHIKSLETELENKGELLRLAARSEHSLEQDLISAQRRGDGLQQQVADQQFQLQLKMEKHLQNPLSSPSSAFTFLVPRSPSSPILNLAQRVSELEEVLAERDSQLEIAECHLQELDGLQAQFAAVVRGRQEMEEKHFVCGRRLEAFEILERSRVLLISDLSTQLHEVCLCMYECL
jgi:hypothetical protein